MIGVFDSGAGGRFALAELRRLRKKADIIFLADKKNAPYGSKSEKELISLVTNDVKRLREAGAKRILVACCTASTVWDKLTIDTRNGVMQIISTVAKRALNVSSGGRIGVLSTEATRKSGAFKRWIPHAVCYSAPELVTLAESGARDVNLTHAQKQILKKSLSPFFESNIDTLILGCTHFAYFEGEIENILGVKTVNSARVAAEEFAKTVSDEGNGMTYYIE